MKRFSMWIMVICMLCTLMVPALADEVIAVHYGIEAQYLVTIPESVSVASTVGGQRYAELSVDSMLIPSNTTLTVALTGNSYENGKWHLKNSDAKLGYYIVAEDDDGKFASVASDATLLSCKAGESGIERSLCFVLADAIQTAGTYQDILTFIVTYNT